MTRPDQRPPADGARIAALCVLLAGLTLGCGGAAEPPNVIVLLIDTQRADHLGTYGFPGDISPNLDRLAAESLVFDNAFAQAPWTKPSIASLFTSLYPQSHRVTSHEGENWGALRDSVVANAGAKALAPEAVTLAEAFRHAGYRTAAFVANPFVSEIFGFGQGFDTYDVRRNFGANRADQLASAARAWLDSREPDRPFFLYLHFMDVHAPYAAPQEDFLAMSDAVTPSSRELNRNERPDLRFRNFEVRPAWATEAQRRSVDYWRTRYASGVRMLDRRLAPLLTYLQDSGLLGSTFVVVTSDHGEELFEHGSWSHGYSYYDHQLRVPLLIRSPGAGTAGRRTDALVEGVDIMPTLLAAAGIALPGGVQGRDLSALLRGGSVDEAEFCFAAGSLEPRRAQALRSKEHKLILDLDSSFSELYDLLRDPGEQEDVVAAHRALAAGLTAQLRRHLRETLADGTLGPADVEVPADVLEDIEALGYVGR